MLMGGLSVHHEGGKYRISIPAGAIILNGVQVKKDTPIMFIDFGRNGDTLTESKKIQVFVRHMKEVYKVRNGFNQA